MEETVDRERIWAYVHGELPQQERAGLERAIEQDATIRDELEAIRSFDDRLRALMPLTEQTQEGLGSRILEAWEKETQDKAQERAPGGRLVFFPRLRELLTAPRFGRVVLGVAAAAAAILILTGVPHYYGGPIRWEKPEFTCVHYRGAEAESVSHYTGEDAATCFSLLRERVQAGYDRQQGKARRLFGLAGKREWTLSFRFQELPKRDFCVIVNACDTRRNPVGKWTRYYSTVEEFRKDVDELGSEIAGKLAGDGEGAVK